jgi:hypothetical protein
MIVKMTLHFLRLKQSEASQGERCGRPCSRIRRKPFFCRRPNRPKESWRRGIKAFGTSEVGVYVVDHESGYGGATTSPGLGRITAGGST